MIEVLRDVPGISFTHFKAKDVVRHPLVQRIVEAYERFENRLHGETRPKDRPPRCLSLICNWPPRRAAPERGRSSANGANWPCASAAPTRS